MGALGVGEWDWGSGVCARGGAQQPRAQGGGIPAPRRGPCGAPAPTVRAPPRTAGPGAETPPERALPSSGGAEGRPGLCPVRCRQNLPASRLLHPDHESATVGEINCNFKWHHKACGGLRPRLGCWVCSRLDAGGRTRGPGTPIGRPWGS